MIRDGYYYCLEKPDNRQIAFLNSDIAYWTDTFDCQVYSEDRGVRFPSRESAYLDWMANGRRQGCRYAQGKDTCLKIVLKAKDEPELIEAWLSHHSKIVGRHNIIIMDCGSRDESYLAYLDTCRRDYMVLPYGKYYDSLHAPAGNRGLFSALAMNCRFLTILDADEFLLYYEGGAFHNDLITTVLRNSDELVYAGGWIYNAESPQIVDGKFVLDAPLKVTFDAAALRTGLFSGKSIVRSSALFDVRHVGHNFHVQEVIDRMTLGSLGKFFVLHLGVLDKDVVCRRIANHLVSKKVIVKEADLEKVSVAVRSVRGQWLENEVVLGYIDKFIAHFDGSRLIRTSFDLDLRRVSRGPAPGEFRQVVDDFDYSGFLDRYVKSAK